MWERVWRFCEKRGPVAPSVRAMFGDSRAVPAVLTSLRSTRVARMVSLDLRGENWREEEDSESEGEEGGPSPPWNVFFVFSLSFSIFLFNLWRNLGGTRDGGPNMTGSVGLRSWKTGYFGEPNNWWDEKESLTEGR